MSVLLGERELREQLMATNEEYRRLAAEHQMYARQLEQLSSRHYLSEEERRKEITLKKKKLLMKDQMYMLLQKYRHGMQTDA